MRGCIIRVPPRIHFYLFCDRLCADETKPFQTKVLCGNAEAVKLLVGFPVPDGDKEGQGVPARGLDLGARPVHKRATGFPGLAGYSPQRAHSQGGQHRGFQEGGCERGLAKDLKDSPLIFGLLVYGNIVDQVPKRK